MPVSQNRSRLPLPIGLVAVAVAVVLAAWSLHVLAAPPAAERRPYAPRLASVEASASARAAGEASMASDAAAADRSAGATAAAGSAVLTASQPLVTAPLPVPAVDVRRVVAHAARLEAFGVRARGSEAERSAAAYVRSELVSMGYDARVEEFALPGGARSQNVVATIAGSDSRVVVLGAHIDTKPPSAGANDNASGCALLLELARLAREHEVVPSLQFVFFGAEEAAANPSDHHVGSRFRVSAMRPDERRATAGMISVDMVGLGERFLARTMGRGPRSMSDAMLAEARRQNIPMSYKRDPGASGWSDHEPFELAGIPSVWIERPDDPAYHTARDRTPRLERKRLEQTGRLLAGFLAHLDRRDLDALGR